MNVGPGLWQAIAASGLTGLPALVGFTNLAAIAGMLWTSALSAVALVLALPSLTLMAECLLAAVATRWPKAAATSGSNLSASLRPALGIIVPAHDESLSIAATLAPLLAQLGPRDRVLVVADNCSDNTAEIARAAGAQVLERTHATERGKGFALAAGMDFFRASPPGPPAIIIILDADVPPPPGLFDSLISVVSASTRPAQAPYLLEAPPEAGVRGVVSTLAFTVKNIVRPTGLHFIGLPVPLTGTAMAFPWKMLASASLASGHLVEDMKLGIDLLLAGTPTVLAPSITIRGLLPNRTKTAYQQRTRWEHGHLLVIQKHLLPLLKAVLARRSFTILAVGLDLLVPPLALLTLLVSLVCVLGLVTGLLLGHWLPLSLAFLSAVAILMSVAVSWSLYARHLPITALLAAPFYVLWKLPLYLRFLRKPQLRWVRTDRTS